MRWYFPCKPCDCRRLLKISKFVLLNHFNQKHEFLRKLRGKFDFKISILFILHSSIVERNEQFDFVHSIDSMHALNMNSQNPGVPSTLQSFNYDSCNSNQAYGFSIPPSLPPHAMMPKRYPNQKRNMQRSYQSNYSNNSSYNPRYSSVRHPYTPRRQDSSYQNFQPANGYVRPPTQHAQLSPYGSQSPSNGFSHHRRFSNQQYRHPSPVQVRDEPICYNSHLSLNQLIVLNFQTFHCESCDKGFAIEEKYKEHVAEHMTCDRDGCSFTAHPKIVEKHVIMQHNSGLFKRIVRGNNPEEIGKWISERKK